MNIIGINGFKRSGKGETGAAIAELALGVKQLGFADKLKIFAARSLGFKLSDADCIALMDEAKETWVMDIVREVKRPDSLAVDGRQGFPEAPLREQIKRWTGRQLLQHMGTEARKVFGDDFWVDQVLPQAPAFADNPGMPSYETVQHELHSMYPYAHVLAFTDLRFENEAQRIIDLGGFNVRLHRPGAESDGHDSELVLPDHLIRHEIYNSGTLDDLTWQVNKVLELEDLRV